MRVIAGRWGGRRLHAPPHSIRPTQDRVRQILFDILGDRVVGAGVLDLCAGSGSLGIEALSRGAARAVFVESNAKVRAVLESNLAAFDARTSARVLGMDLFRALARLEAEQACFDWILADPPYDTTLGADLLHHLGSPASRLLSPSGGLVLEGRADRGPSVTGALRLLRERRIGGTVLWFLAREEPAGAERGDSLAGEKGGNA